MVLPHDPSAIRSTSGSPSRPAAIFRESHHASSVTAPISAQFMRPAVDENILKGIESSNVYASGDLLLDTNEVSTVSSMWDWDFDAGRMEQLSAGYLPVVSRQHISTVPIYQRDTNHRIGGLYSQMNLVSWQNELSYENDRNLFDYLSFGIQNGFYIVNPDDQIDEYLCDNYPSVLKGEAFDFVNRLILEELDQGKFVIEEGVPHCVHAIGAVPKGDGTFRPITDCKRPLGSSINNYMSEVVAPFSYKSLDDVVSLLTPGDFMATVDISSAYRSISVHPDHWQYQGLLWNVNGVDTFLKDTRICFGLANAPFLFTHVSNFVVRCLQRRGDYRMINYLDDFIVIGKDFNSCQQAQMELISLLISLGFQISWKKCSSPSTLTRYLGIDVTMSLPKDKLSKLHSELLFFKDRRRATKHQLQRLCRILSHCAKVVKGARTFSRRVIDLLKGLSEGNPRVSLTYEFCQDLEWWSRFASTFNGISYCIEYNYGQGPEMFTDASFSGYGFVSGSDWLAGHFCSEHYPACVTVLNGNHHHWENVYVKDHNINVLELLPVYLGLQRSAPKWVGLHIVCRTDNTQVMYCLNKGVSTNKEAMALLREIFWLCVSHDIHLTSRHISGMDNTVADWLSRITTESSISKLREFRLCCSGYG